MRWLILGLLIWAGPALAQSVPFQYLPGSDDGLIPSHLFTVPVTIDGHETRFILDTGIGMNLISADLAAQLKCPPVFHGFSGQRMSGQSLEVPLSRVNSLTFAGHKETFVTVGVWDFHGFLPATPAFADIEGFLSLRFFEHLPFTIDYAHHQIVLESAEGLVRRLREGTVVEARLDDEEGVALSCAVPIRVGAETAWAEVDTGSGALILHSRYMTDPSGLRKVEAKDETGHAFVRWFGKLEKPMQFGAVSRKGLSVMFQEIIHDGLVGDDLLSRQPVTFDLSHSRLILGPPTDQ